MTPAGLLLVVAALCVLCQLWLVMREITYQKRRCTRPHGTASDAVTSAPAERARAAQYAVAKLRLGAAGIVMDGLLLLILTFGNGLAWLQAYWSGLLSGETVPGVAVLLCVVALQATAHRALAAVREFAVERRFGFGRFTVALFFRDSLVKGALLLSAAAPLAAVCAVLLDTLGAVGWWGVWLAWAGFVVLRNGFYPALAARLLNRYGDLSDPELRAALRRLMDAAGCSLDRVLVMDGSRRSSHGNARVEGVGRARRVVLLDTLLEVLTGNEIVAVLAHEIGHVRHRHLPVFLVVQTVLAGFWILGAGLALDGGMMVAATGLPADSPGATLGLLWALTPVCAIVAKPLVAALVRRFEFEADRFAVSVGAGQALGSALRKLGGRNAITEESDPLYAAVYLSHPTLQLRLERIGD